MLSILGERVLVIPHQEKSTILMVNNKSDKFMVTHIGDEVTKLKIGDMVYIKSYSPHTISYEGINYFAYNQDDILAKIST